MSDARPITNITDYVCGSCWNSFSRTDPGVVQGDQLVCPHCGHVLPHDAQAGDIASMVSAAPAQTRGESRSFGANLDPISEPVVPLTVSSQSAAPSQSGRTSQGRQAAAVQDEGFPELESQDPYGWLPPDVGNSGTLRRDADGAYVVGDADDDMDFNEPTLRPDQNHSDLLALVRNMPRHDSSGSPRKSGFVAGEEPEIDADVEEKTPLEADALPHAVVLGAAEVPGTEADVIAMATASLATVPDLGPEESGAEDGESDWELRDWKLKAMGLTYNFHGLEALLNWASNKAGQTMSLSADGGTTWKDFHSFFEGVTNGLPAQKAFEDAAEPGAGPPPSQPMSITGRLPRATATHKPVSAQAPDLQVPTKSTGPHMAPVADKAPASEPAAPTPTRNGPAVPPTSNAGGASRQMQAVSPSRTVQSAHASRRTPVAARAPQKEGLSPGKLAMAVAVIVVVVAALLHVQGVVRIPGLPVLH